MRVFSARVASSAYVTDVPAAVIDFRRLPNLRRLHPLQSSEGLIVASGHGKRSVRLCVQCDSLFRWHAQPGLSGRECARSFLLCRSAASCSPANCTLTPFLDSTLFERGQRGHSNRAASDAGADAGAQSSHARKSNAAPACHLPAAAVAVCRNCAGGPDAPLAAIVPRRFDAAPAAGVRSRGNAYNSGQLCRAPSVAGSVSRKHHQCVRSAHVHAGGRRDANRSVRRRHDRDGRGSGAGDGDAQPAAAVQQGDAASGGARCCGGHRRARRGTRGSASSAGARAAPDGHPRARTARGAPSAR
jgi:hypothetical protein